MNIDICILSHEYEYLLCILIRIILEYSNLFGFIIIMFHSYQLPKHIILGMNRTYALTSSRRHVGGQSHCLVCACATGTFLTTAFTRNPIDPQAAAHFCFFDGVTSYA